MILPHTYFAALVLLILGVLCWGSWATTYKLAGKWRYELYYFDWIFGAVLTTVVLALTAGSMGYDGFSFRDALMIAGRRQWLWAFLAGVSFNFGNMLLMACLSVAGITVAFPMAAGIAMIVGAVASYALAQFGPAVFLLLGCGFLAGGVVAAALVYRHMLIVSHEQIARAGKAKSTRRPGSTKAIVLAMVSGLFLGTFVPLLNLARQGEIGLGPYATAVLFVFGALASTFILNLFLMNLPVEGEPVEVLEYVRGAAKSHFWGILGGAIWSVGLIAFLAVASLTEPVRPGPVAINGLGQAWAVVAAVWGIVAWKELRGGDGRVKALTGLMLLLLVGGISLFGVAPLFVTPR